MFCCSIWKGWWSVVFLRTSQTKERSPPPPYTEKVSSGMCTKLKTTMACGHSFVTNHTDDCNHSSTPCSTPEMRYQFIYDTCAVCDPEALRRRVKQDYDYRHQELMNVYMEAKKLNNKVAMSRIEDLIMENTKMTRERNFEVGLVQRDPDVLFQSEWQDYRKQ
ncbi:hypothetical protein BGZ63DRAFT_462481 [Mariannaea sp. PMI_226]|nr:hypothetical protein BGZ63DRAFT_462481 [Mariannaea sp. PMI_226]